MVNNIHLTEQPEKESAFSYCADVIIPTTITEISKVKCSCTKWKVAANFFPPRGIGVAKPMCVMDTKETNKLNYTKAKNCKIEQNKTK